jgi:hypothetical protein
VEMYSGLTDTLGVEHLRVQWVSSASSQPDGPKYNLPK